ncbi:hypothetical protein OsJ_31002 [Oryza sativa Japonica Group]|uniref:Uncharacterized protein n=3 Tax=Oryza TaxID=4527 RepID=A3C3D0_ORYSJ|nr:hypothetical protein [Oryza sativa Japonica Group]AAP52701.1 hypothetical protein LOC_Os10g13560 [Oryza sativa Japonica Group]EAZ15593.1 hypothetical protein OsJ_31002 [Oryza sativa Japonica Group]
MAKIEGTMRTTGSAGWRQEIEAAQDQCSVELDGWSMVLVEVAANRELNVGAGRATSSMASCGSLNPTQRFEITFHGGELDLT